MTDLNLQAALSNIDISAEWVGLREVKEATTYRVIRDGNPQANMIDTSHGVMVEVLKDGQFGYSGTSDLSFEGINKATQDAYGSASKASKHSVFSFNISLLYAH